MLSYHERMVKHNMPDLEERRREFFQHVWDHSKDPFQAQFDLRRPLTRQEISAVEKLVELFREQKDDKAIAAVIPSLVQENGEEFIDLLLQLSGQTRNKILGDLRASAEIALAGEKIPGSHRRIVEEAIWKYAGPYLVARLRPVFSNLASVPSASRLAALEALNQATYPGFIRQERAKRSGHEAEYRLATLLEACGIPFEPKEKASNPLCRDVAIHGVSFDLVVPNAEVPLVCVKATVHTANIGQYGESKDHLEVDEARRMLNSKFPQRQQPKLLVLIDGVGFKSNAAGLNGVLEKTDEFCQFRTLWKAAVVCAAAVGKVLKIELSREATKAQKPFIERYHYEKFVVPAGSEIAGRRVPAGEASVVIGLE